jgi:hypothetical protein
MPPSNFNLENPTTLPQPSHNLKRHGFIVCYKLYNPLYHCISINSNLLEGIYHYREWEGGRVGEGW